MSLTLALAGNPNVGKSTVFNALTGARQHTGNWAGKTVELAEGHFSYDNIDVRLVDLPGTYSLSAESVDERTARDYICFGGADGIIIVCDATCLERNLILALQTLEITGKVIICLNLMDEAAKKNIVADTLRLSELLGVKVIPMSARSGDGIELLKAAVKEISDAPPMKINCGPTIETAISMVETAIFDKLCCGLNPRWVAIKLLEGDSGLLEGLTKYLGYNITAFDDVAFALKGARELLRDKNFTAESLCSRIMHSKIQKIEYIISEVIKEKGSFEFDRRLDRVFTGKIFAVPIMLGVLLGIMWLTAVGANYPSAALSSLFSRLEEWVFKLLSIRGCPILICNMLSHGILRVLGWVVSVMLPPMAIFFPLFTLMEDFGYLPRIAFNLDGCFRRCGACGKQALTTCMGFGCNAVGVTGCRIIDSPREKIMAMLTNCFIPCNGRLPSLIAIISIFLAQGSVIKALLLTAAIIGGVAASLGASALLNKSLLRGLPSSFALELPPYRRPQVGKVIVRSILDRTIHVLGRAVTVAAPAGLVIWLLANIQLGGAPLLTHISDFLEPIGRIMGLDGVILLGFILGFPANEIVIPLILMGYNCSGALMEYESLSSLNAVLTANGWTRATAICFIIFTLCHFPCSTTCLTIYKESKSLKWTAWSVIIPTAAGFILCAAVNALLSIF